MQLKITKTQIMLSRRFGIAAIEAIPLGKLLHLGEVQDTIAVDVEKREKITAVHRRYGSPEDLAQ